MIAFDTGAPKQRDSALTEAQTVAAVVVTYNRARLLLECLAALLNQTRPVDRIVLIDNASTDGTAEILREHHYLDHPRIHYVRLANNTGGAGGFSEGMRLAHAMGYDWMWIMDDDAEPYADALETMEPHLRHEGVGGVANLTIGLDGKPQAEHRGWLTLNNATPRAHRAIDPGDLEKTREISFASFVGLAVHRSAVDRVGLPKKEMFIKADDLEYCVRLATLGPLILVPGSKIRHKDGVNVIFERRRRFGFESARVPLDKLWLGYFSLRNLSWIRLQHCGRGIAAMFAIRQLLRLSLGILVFDTDRLIRMRFYWNAVGDAWAGVFDNDKPKRLTRR
jgi:GT2 family glycosyltransferase